MALLRAAHLHGPTLRAATSSASKTPAQLKRQPVQVVGRRWWTSNATYWHKSCSTAAATIPAALVLDVPKSSLTDRLPPWHLHKSRSRVDSPTAKGQNAAR